MEGDDEPGDAPCCPVSRATKKRVRELHSARVTKHALKEVRGRCGTYVHARMRA